VALNAESIHAIARISSTEQAVFQAVENQFDLLEIRAILSDCPHGDILRAWLQCFRIPIQQPGNAHQQWALMKVSELLYGEGEEIEGLTLPLVLERFAPWLRAS
jgi:hypothetical protein